jgi:hypothetical protein
MLKAMNKLLDLFRRKQPPQMLLKNPRECLAVLPRLAAKQRQRQWALDGVRRREGR